MPENISIITHTHTHAPPSFPDYLFLVSFLDDTRHTYAREEKRKMIAKHIDKAFLSSHMDSERYPTEIRLMMCFDIACIIHTNLVFKFVIKELNVMLATVNFAPPSI